MTMPDIAVIATGVANIASVLHALQRTGAAPVCTTDPAAVERATAVVLPGVGAFDAGMAALRTQGLDAALRQRIAADRPTLAICLGLQLLLDGSDESVTAEPGLGIVRGRARRFPATVRVPQLGWNNVQAAAGCRVLRDGDVYFANSYRLVEPPPDCHCALAEHGGPFVAGFERGNLTACQFHPELSGVTGAALLQRFVDHALEAAPCR